MVVNHSEQADTQRRKNRVRERGEPHCALFELKEDREVWGNPATPKCVPTATAKTTTSSGGGHCCCLSSAGYLSVAPARQLHSNAAFSICGVKTTLVRAGMTSQDRFGN